MLTLQQVYKSIYKDGYKESLNKILKYLSLSIEDKHKANTWIDEMIYLIETDYDYEFDYGRMHRISIVDFPYNHLHQAIQAREYKLVKAILELKIYKTKYDDKDRYKENNPLHTLTSIPNIDYVMLILNVNCEKKEIIKKHIGKANDMKLLGSVSVSIVKQVLRGKTDFTEDDLIELEKQTKEEEYKIANLLLDYKNDYLNDTNKNGHTSLQNALLCKNFHLVRFLMSKGAIAKTDYYGYSLFSLAAMSGNVDLVKEVVDMYGYDKGKDSKVLCNIVNTNNIPMIKLLLELGLNVNCTNNMKETPLHNAVKSGYKQIVDILISNGACIDTFENILGFTPLFLASRYPDIVKLLLDNGSDPNRVTKISMYTPLKKTIPECIESAKIMVRYIILSKYKNRDNLLTNKGLSINMELIKGNTELIEEQKSCESELKLMESIRLNKNYSLSDFLKYDNVKALSPLAYHQKVINIKETVFTKYYTLLSKSIQKVKHRAIIVDNTVLELYNYLENTYWSLLPIELGKKIISLLDDKDITCMISQIEN
ncbi:ankyrin repeat containing protein [Finch poxvirus]|uniref:Ankyrin repeat containing protein n=1 Tax=Condorpox virus TaxID=3049970 RepID=A0AAT9URY2_9POXV|nr:ankyrin repeat containing protein [Finch poxvirus]UOX38877.1 ankyrin repeat containing protein [Finch poxvirus]